MSKIYILKNQPDVTIKEGQITYTNMPIDCVPVDIDDLLESWWLSNHMKSQKFSEYLQEIIS